MTVSNNRIGFLFLLLWVLANGTNAQTSTVSPYSRHGLGRLSDPSAGGARSMGGTSIGMRNPFLINPYNPASYSDADSTTFLFDLGVSAGVIMLNEAGKSQNAPVGGLDHAALKFPIAKNLGASVGLLPFSTTAYEYVTPINEVAGSQIYSGSGSISQVYVGLAYQFFNCVSLGANVSYLFGYADNSSTMYFDDSSINSSILLKSFSTHSIKYDIGAQFAHRIGKADRLVVGATFSPKIQMNSAFRHVSSLAGSVTKDTTFNYQFDTPQTYGLGVSYSIKNKWLIAVDGQYQEWAKSHYFNKTDTLQNRLRLSAGVEFLPDVYSRSFFKRLRYRGGVHVSNSYFDVGRSGLSEFGVGVGLGIPLNMSRTINSMVNLNFDYMRSQSKNTLLLTEDYFRFTVNITFNEFWFFKRKLE